MSPPETSPSRAGRLSAVSRSAVEESERAIAASRRLLRRRCYPDDGAAPRLGADER
jgi:hypothetical protein